MAKIAAEKSRQPSPVWTVDPLLAYASSNQDITSAGVDNAAFYDSESGLCTKMASVRVVDPYPRKRTSWAEDVSPVHYPKKQCNGRVIFLIFATVVLLILVATVALVVYLAVGEVQLTWDGDESYQELDEGISLVEGHIRITNRVFTKDLLNPNSQSYHKLSALVKQSMDAVFFQSGLGPYYNETGIIAYEEGSVVARCMIHLSKPRLDATHQVGMAIIQALERHHGYLPGGFLQVDIRSLHFTGLLPNDETIEADVVRLQADSWGPWSEWSPCAEPCEVQTRVRECLDVKGNKSVTSDGSPCGDLGNREVRNCPCNPVQHIFATAEESSEATVSDEECSGDCKDAQICLLLSPTSTARCLVPRDINDPTGCGGWCVEEHQLCRPLGNSTFQCVDNVAECEEESQEWRCDNGLCIPVSGRCDGQLDCYDMSDEYNCECNEGEFHCGNNTSCLLKSALCNGQVDCWDGSDELNCTLLCPIDQYTCNSGICVDKLRFCDGFPDCDDGSDEPEGCSAPCLHTQNQCRNGRCVNVLLWCNGVDNCGDGTDEIACDPPQLLRSD